MNNRYSYRRDIKTQESQIPSLDYTWPVEDASWRGSEEKRTIRLHGKSVIKVDRNQ